VLSIVVNGSSRVCTDQATIADLIRELALEGKRVAIERNGEIVPKSRLADTPPTARTTSIRSPLASGG